ncbi:MAG: hypothetical protein ACFFF9_08455 [Candidatus Thorarchaeota archaeon]
MMEYLSTVFLGLMYFLQPKSGPFSLLFNNLKMCQEPLVEYVNTDI